MRRSLNPLLPLAIAALALPSQAAIIWSTTAPAGYIPGTTAQLTATNAQAAGVSMDFSSNHAGTFGLGGGSRNVCFTTTADIAAGTPIELFFDFSHMLGSGGSSSPFSPPPRAAAKFRLDQTTSVSIDTLMYGGMDTFQNYWANGGTSTTTPATGINNGIVEFQDVFMQDPGAPGGPSFGQGPTSAVFRGFSDSNTATITGGDNDPIISIDGDPISGDDITLFDIVDPHRPSVDLSFSGWRFTVTPNETLTSGSKFLFTFEGAIVGDRIDLAIPEPSRVVLLLLGVPLVFRRRR